MPSLARGEIVGCFGLMESGYGSDVSGIGSRARKEGNYYILTSKKTWVTLANVANHMLVFAKTDSSHGTRGITAFILERGWDGVTTGTVAGKMGVRASDTGWIKMEL